MCKGSVEGGRASGQEEEGDEGEAGSPDQSFDCATTRKRYLLSEAGGSCGGGEGGACRRIVHRGMRVGDRGRGRCRLLGQRASLHRLRGAEALSVSLSVNLSDNDDVQLAEAALQVAASSFRSRSRDKEEDDDRAPVRRLVLHQAHQLGYGEGQGNRGERASAGSLASPRKIIKEEGLDIVRAVGKYESNNVPC